MDDSSIWPECQRGFAWDIATVIEIFKCILRGTAGFHRQNIAHTDLKPGVISDGSGPLLFFVSISNTACSCLRWMQAPCNLPQHCMPFAFMPILQGCPSSLCANNVYSEFDFVILLTPVVCDHNGFRSPLQLALLTNYCPNPRHREHPVGSAGRRRRGEDEGIHTGATMRAIWVDKASSQGGWCVPDGTPICS